MDTYSRKIIMALRMAAAAKQMNDGLRVFAVAVMLQLSFSDSHVLGLISTRGRLTGVHA